MYPLAIVLPTFSRGKVLKRSAELYWPSILAENGARFFSLPALSHPRLLSLIQVERFYRAMFEEPVILRKKAR